MERYLLVAAGGAAGAVARYAVGVQASRLFGPGQVAGTLTVNVIGGLLMGVLAGWVATRGGEGARLLLGVGVLGGFTTFSAFSLETAQLLERRDYALAGGYVLASVIFSVLALFAGLLIARRLLA
jgi:CrcB protein